MTPSRSDALALTLTPRRFERTGVPRSLRARVENLVDRNPERVAAQLRAWLLER